MESCCDNFNDEYYLWEQYKIRLIDANSKITTSGIRLIKGAFVHPSIQDAEIGRI